MKMLGKKTQHHHADPGEETKPKRALKREEESEWREEYKLVITRSGLSDYITLREALMEYGQSVKDNDGK